MTLLIERDKISKEYGPDAKPDGAGIRKGIDNIEVKQEGDSLLRFIISTSSIDRDHDTIDAAGWELANYRKNPVMLWAHSHRDPPVGQSIRIITEDDKLISDTLFTSPDISAFGDMIFKLYMGGFMRAVSVGFMPLEWVWVDEQGGFRFEKQELLEFSAVPVPANPEALIVARAGGIDTSAMKFWAEKVIDEWNDSDHLGITNKEMKRLAKAADSKHKSYHHLTDSQQKDLREENLNAIWTARLKIFQEEAEWDEEEYGPAPYKEGCKAPDDLVKEIVSELYLYDDDPDPLKEAKWKQRLTDFEKNGQWFVSWGPSPNDNDCLAPHDMIKRVRDACLVLNNRSRIARDDSEKDIDRQVQVRIVTEGGDDIVAVLDAEKCAEAADLPDGWTSDDLIKVLAGPRSMKEIGETDQATTTDVSVVGEVAIIHVHGCDKEETASAIATKLSDLDWCPKDIDIFVVDSDQDGEVKLHADQEALIKIRERLEQLGLSDIDTLELEDIEVSAEEQASRKDIEDRLEVSENSTKQWKKAAEDLIKAVDDLQAENDELTESVIESELNKDLETEKSAVVVLLQAFKSGINRITGRID